MRTAGNPIFIKRVVLFFKTSPGVKRNISFIKVFMISERITGKKFWIECRSIKSSIAKERFGMNQWMLKKEIFHGWD